MSRIISNYQKKEIFKAISSSFTIGETTVIASKIWSNQELTSYPTITLNVSVDGLPELADVVDGILYYSSTLTIHILARTISGIPGARLAETIANEIMDEIAGWTTPLTEDVRIFDSEEDIKSLQMIDHESDIFDYAFSATVYHS